MTKIGTSGLVMIWPDARVAVPGLAAGPVLVPVQTPHPQMLTQLFAGAEAIE